MGNEPRKNPLTAGADPDEGVDQGILILTVVWALAEAAYALLLSTVFLGVKAVSHERVCRC